MSLFILSQQDFEKSLVSAHQASQPHKIRKLTKNSSFSSSEQFEAKQQQSCCQTDDFASFPSRRKFTYQLQLFGQIKAVLFAKPEEKGIFFSLNIRLLTPHQWHYKIPNSYQITQVSRNLAFHYNQFKGVSARLAINAETRQLKVEFPPILKSSLTMKLFGGSSIRTEKQNFPYLLNLIIRPYTESVKRLLKYALKTEESLGIIDNLETQESKQMKMLNRYCQMSNVEINLKTQVSRQDQQLKRPTSLSQTFQTNLKASKAPVFMHKNCKLYSPCSQAEDSNYNLSASQLKAIKNMLLLPIQSKNKNGSEQYGVLNYILVKEANKPGMLKINEGGFADIYHTSISFWHICSEEENLKKSLEKEELFWEENLLEKEIVVKKQISTGTEFNRKSRSKKGEGSRLSREMQIVRKMKNGKPIFIPKYYIPVNKVNPFPKSVLIDYVPTKTLTEFLNSYESTLSLQTKLCYMFSITQALRYLKDFEVVHLDLKPSNILMYHSLLVKLIDFGESYHPSLCDKNFQPGFSVPYSCPQLYGDTTTYTSKADVFSLGVILFQMLYNKCPFNILTDTAHIDQQMKKFQDLWYFSAEECQTYGDSGVLRLLNILISKCLAVRPEERPELDWIALILRYLIEIVH